MTAVSFISYGTFGRGNGEPVVRFNGVVTAAERCHRSAAEGR